MLCYGNTISIDFFTAFLHPERRAGSAERECEEDSHGRMEGRLREVTACELELSYRPSDATHLLVVVVVAAAVFVVAVVVLFDGVGGAVGK